MNGSTIWGIVSLVLAVVGGIALYFTFLRKKNDGKFKGFWGWMYDFLAFKKMFVEEILKVLYYMVAIFITLGSFTIINQFGMFLVTLVIGNIIARLTFELMLVVLVICRNTTTIATRITSLDRHFVPEIETKKAEKTEKVSAE